MKTYYTDKILPTGFREMTDAEFREYIIEQSKKGVSGAVCRKLIPLKEGEAVFLRTFAGTEPMPSLKEFSKN